MENQTDLNVTKLIFKFSPDCFLLLGDSRDVYPNIPRAPHELFWMNLEYREKLVPISCLIFCSLLSLSHSFPLSFALSLCV